MIVIPMCGKSSRFFDAGYKLPKYMLELNTMTVFEWSLLSFKKYFDKEIFIIICNSNEDFIYEKVKSLNIKNFKIINLNKETTGQASTVYEGLSKLKINDRIWIFNIDSKLLKFEIPVWIDECDGYLEVFEDNISDNWSFISIDENNNINKVTEKERISNLCSDGLYYFSSIDLFNRFYLKSKMIRNEFYIAPIYNELIKENLKVKFNLINKSDILFCNIPKEYESLRISNANK